MKLGLALLLVAAAAHADTAAPDAEARALLAKWAAAQNKGDFAAYQALYADGFHGVRRSGQRTVELDRDGWLRDRARMFKKPMRVDAITPAFATAPDGVMVRFTQRFEQGSYRDVGPKLMLLARAAGGLRIAREEMLASTVLGLHAEKFAPLVEGEVVLSAAPSRAWAAGALVEVREGGFTMPDARADQPVDRAKLPSAIAARVGTRVRLLSEEKVRCEATIGTPHIVYFAGGDCIPDDERAPTRVDWDEAQKLLLAPLIGAPDGCGGSWAVPADRPPSPPVAGKGAKQLVPKLRAAMAAAADDPRLPEAVREHLRHPPSFAPWEPSLYHMVERGRRVTLVAWAAGWRVLLVWEAASDQGDGLALRGVAANVTQRPPSAVDLDGDGEVDFFDMSRAFVRTGALYEEIGMDAAPKLLGWHCPDCGAPE